MACYYECLECGKLSVKKPCEKCGSKRLRQIPDETLLKRPTSRGEKPVIEDIIKEGLEIIKKEMWNP